MSRKILTAVFLVLAFALSGQGADKKVEIVPDPVFPAQLEAPAKQLAERLALGLAESLRSGDFAAFDAVQPEASKRKFTREIFDKMRTALDQRYGKLVNAEYFGRLEQGRVMDFLWKLSFEKNEAKDKAVRREILLQIRTGSVKGEVIIAGFRYCFF